MTTRAWVGALCLALSLSCSSAPSNDAGIDAGGTDAGATDAGGTDAGLPDAGAMDAGADDAGAPDAGIDAGCVYDATTRTGQATAYSSSTGGKCLTPQTFTHHVALPSGGYLALCGACLEVAGPEGTTTVIVDDECPGCAANDLDLSEAAFNDIADASVGRVAISWKTVPCAVTGNVAVDFQGSNPYYLKLRLTNLRNALVGVAVQPANASTPTTLTRTADDFWVLSGGGPYDFPLTVQATDVFGATITLSVPTLVNNTPIDGGAQFPAVCGP